MSDTVSIRITADTSGIEAGIQEVRGDLGALKSTVQGAADSMSQGFAGVRGAVEKSAQSVDTLSASIRQLKPQEIVSGLNEMASALKENSAALQELAAKSGEGKGGFGKLVEGIKGAAGVAGDLYEVGKKAAEAIVAMGESSEKVTVLSKQLGMSTHQVQLLQGMAKATGTDFTKLSQSTETLSKNFTKSPDTFKKLGIDIKAGSDQMTILTTVADKFAKTADGPQKTAMAIKLMGKAGAETIPFLNQGGAAISALAQKTEAYGAVNDGAVKSGTKLGESVNEAKIAWDGITQTVTAALAPVLTVIVDRFNQLAKAFAQSYTGGGLVKTIFDLLSGAINGVGEIINTLGTAFADLWQISGAGGVNWSEVQHTLMNAVITVLKAVVAAVVSLAISFKIEFELIAGYALDWWGQLKEAFEFASLGIETIKKTFKLFGQVAYDALTLKWGSISSDWDKGLADIDAAVRRRGAEIVGDAKKASEQAQGYFRAAEDLRNSTRGIVAGITGATPPPPHTGVASNTPSTDDGNSGGGGHNSGGTPRRSGGGGASGVSPKDRASEWEEALERKRLAFEKEADAEGSLREMSKADEVAYWKTILDTAQLTQSEREQIEKKYYGEARDVRKQDLDDSLAAFKKQIEAAQGNVPKLKETTDRIVATFKTAYGEKSKEAEQAERQIVETVRKSAEEQKRIEEKKFQDFSEGEQKYIDAVEKRDEFLVQMGVKTQGQMLQGQIAAERAKAAADDEFFKGELKRYEGNKTAWDALQTQKQNAAKTANAKITDLERKALLERTQLERQAINATAQLWSQNFSKLLTFQQSFATTVQNLYKGMVGILSDALAQIIQKWLTQHLSALLLGKAASKAAAMDQIATSAGVAGANGVASYAAAPWPLDMAAPEFGALMSGYAMSFASFSAAGGWYDVPHDGALTELHKSEMVLPAWAAQPLRSMLGSAPANSNAPIAANDGSGGYHYHDHSARGLTESQIIANRNAFAKAMKMAHREGKLGFFLPG